MIQSVGFSANSAPIAGLKRSRPLEVPICFGAINMEQETRTRSRSFLWGTVAAGLLALIGTGSASRTYAADNPPPANTDTEKKSTDDDKESKLKPELSWLKRSGPMREIDVATLLQAAEKKDKALEEKLKLADVQASPDRLKRVTDAKTRLHTALVELQAEFAKDPGSDETTLKARTLITACIVDPALRKLKESWAPNTVRWAACDQSQTAGFHKIVNPLFEVLEMPDAAGLYPALASVQRIPALRPEKKSSEASPVAAAPQPRSAAPSIQLASWGRIEVPARLQGVSQQVTDVAPHVLTVSSAVFRGFSLFRLGGGGGPQMRLVSPNVGDLQNCWLKADNKAMTGKRKVMIVYHSQEAFKPEVVLFINKMSSIYGLSLGENTPEDIEKLIKEEKSQDFGDFIVVCPKGATTEQDVSAAFDRMQTFAKNTPGAEGFVYIDAHGSQRGAEEGLEDLDMLEGATKGITHFPEAEVPKTFWMKESHKLREFKGAIPFIIDTCHSAANLAMAEPMPSPLRVS